MKQTDNYGFNLIEPADVMSPEPLNENAEKLDEELALFRENIATEFGARVRMACGTYTGTGAMSAAVSTPGFTAKVLLVKNKNIIQAGTSDALAATGGWAVWVGENLPCKYVAYYYTTATDRYSENLDSTIKFTPMKGAISWSVSTPVPTTVGSRTYYVDAQPHLANNTSGTTYQWIAFGTAEAEV